MKRRSTGGLERLSFGFGFEQSKACAGCGGPWAVILSWWVVFVVKMGYPILLVPDTLDGSTRLCMSSGSLFQFV
jgi:hypothetical protein